MEQYVDIHGMTVVEATIELNHMLDAASDTIQEIIVVHGYIHGHILMDFVRHQYRHKRIERKMITMNPGETILVLRQKGKGE